MSQTGQRLSTFFIGVPLVILLILFDIYNHLPLNIAVVFTIFMVSIEMYTILSSKLQTQPKYLFIFLIMLLPVTGTIVAVLHGTTSFIYLAFIIAIMISFCYEIFSPDNLQSFEGVPIRLATTTFAIVYIGLFSTYITQLTMFENSDIFILFFLLSVFGCDSFAWLFGMLFGKNNRGFIKASPNKSIIGFVGGIFGSAVVGLCFFYFFAELFQNQLIFVIVTSISVAIASIIGDLVESALKRSTDCKDSGTSIPGRGGFLDSMDSVLFAAPLYFILTSVFFV